MRTRRSPRNQERLWRDLGGAAKAAPEAQPVRLATVADLDAYRGHHGPAWAIARREAVLREERARVAALLRAEADSERRKP